MRLDIDLAFGREHLDARTGKQTNFFLDARDEALAHRKVGVRARRHRDLVAAVDMRAFWRAQSNARRRRHQQHRLCEAVGLLLARPVVLRLRGVDEFLESVLPGERLGIGFFGHFRQLRSELLRLLQLIVRLANVELGTTRAGTSIRADVQPLLRGNSPVCVGVKGKAGAKKAFTVVALLTNEIAKTELRIGATGVELDPVLLRIVVHDQLVVSSTFVFFRFVAGQAAVGMPLRCLLAVVDAARDNRAVGVAVKEGDDDLLANARHMNRAPSFACIRVAHPYPTRCLFVAGIYPVPVKAYFRTVQVIGVDFLVDWANHSRCLWMQGRLCMSEGCSVFYGAALHLKAIETVTGAAVADTGNRAIWPAKARVFLKLQQPALQAARKIPLRSR